MCVSEIYSCRPLVLKYRSLFRAVGKIVSMWTFRYQQRRELEDLDEQVLRDIGINREQALKEARKPFWAD